MCDTRVSGPLENYEPLFARNASSHKDSGGPRERNSRGDVHQIYKELFFAGFADTLGDDVGETKAKRHRVCAFPESYVRTFFGNYGAIELLVYDEQRGVGSVTFQRGESSQQCFLAVHLSVIPYLGNGSEELRNKRAACGSHGHFSRASDLVIYLEFAQCCPFVNPTLLLLDELLPGEVSRALLHTFPLIRRKYKSSVANEVVATVSQTTHTSSSSSLSSPSAASADTESEGMTETNIITAAAAASAAHASQDESADSKPRLNQESTLDHSKNNASKDSSNTDIAAISATNGINGTPNVDKSSTSSMPKSSKDIHSQPPPTDAKTQKKHKAPRSVNVGKRREGPHFPGGDIQPAVLGESLWVALQPPSTLQTGSVAVTVLDLWWQFYVRYLLNKTTPAISRIADPYLIFAHKSSILQEVRCALRHYRAQQYHGGDCGTDTASHSDCYPNDANVGGYFYACNSVTHQSPASQHVLDRLLSDEVYHASANYIHLCQKLRYDPSWASLLRDVYNKRTRQAVQRSYRQNGYKDVQARMQMESALRHMVADAHADEVWLSMPLLQAAAHVVTNVYFLNLVSRGVICSRALHAKAEERVQACAMSKPQAKDGVQKSKDNGSCRASASASSYPRTSVGGGLGSDVFDLAMLKALQKKAVASPSALKKNGDSKTASANNYSYTHNEDNNDDDDAEDEVCFENVVQVIDEYAVSGSAASLLQVCEPSMSFCLQRGHVGYEAVRRQRVASSRLATCFSILSLLALPLGLAMVMVAFVIYCNMRVAVTRTIKT